MRLLLTAEQAAEQLGIGRTKMFALIKDGTIESITIGKHRRIPFASLVEYINSRRRGKP